MTDENLTPPPAAGYTPPTPPAPAAPYSGIPVAAPSKTLSLIGMIAGIVGVFISLFGGWGLIFSIAALVLAYLGKKREGLLAKPFWLTGLITGYAGVALSVIWLVVYIIGFVVLASVGASIPGY